MIMASLCYMKYNSLSPLKRTQNLDSSYYVGVKQNGAKLCLCKDESYLFSSWLQLQITLKKHVCLCHTTCKLLYEYVSWNHEYWLIKCNPCRFGKGFRKNAKAGNCFSTIYSPWFPFILIDRSIITVCTATTFVLLIDTFRCNAYSD